MSRLPMNPLLAALGAMTSGDDEERRKKQIFEMMMGGSPRRGWEEQIAGLDEMGQRGTPEQNAAFQQRVAQDLQNFGQFQNLKQAKNDAAMALMERNRTYDPQVNADRRDTATNAMMQALADKYGPAFRDRQAGPMSDLNVDDRGQRLIALAEQNRTKGMSKDGKPIRMPGESAADYLARAREFMQRPPNDPAEAKQRMEARKLENTKKEQGFRNQLGMAPFKEKNQELHKQSMEAAKGIRQDMNFLKSERMAKRRAMRQEKSAAEAFMNQLNSITRGMDPADRAKFLADMGKTQLTAQTAMGKQKNDADTIEMAKRKNVVDAWMSWLERFPMLPEDDKRSRDMLGSIAKIHGVDPNDVLANRPVTDAPPRPDLGEPSNDAGSFGDMLAKATSPEAVLQKVNSATNVAEADASMKELLDQFADGDASGDHVKQAIAALRARGINVTPYLEEANSIESSRKLWNNVSQGIGNTEAWIGTGAGSGNLPPRGIFGF